MHIFKTWMNAATREEQELLAANCGTSRGYLYQLSGEFADANPTLAMAIERETAAMARAARGRLPVIYRTDMSPVCRGCNFAQRCLGAKAMRAEFPIVDAALLAELADTEGGSHD